MIKAGEISEIIRRQIQEFEGETDLAEIGRVIEVGDGIARVYGLERAMAGELLTFPQDVVGMVLNLEEDNVGAVLLGEDRAIREGDVVKRTGRIAQVPVGRGPGGPGRQRARPADRRQGPDRRPRSSTRSSATRPAWSTGAP